MKHLDLFSGIGGFALAARWTNKIETIQFVEINKFCQKVLRKNFPNVPIHDDIKTFHYHEHVDLITGGFPCQPFSVAGKKKGKKDDRYLWPEFSRIISECIPNWIIAENVSGIVGMELDNILSDLVCKNYAPKVFILPACAANAPHRRERVWIVAHNNNKRCNMWENNWEERYFQANEKWYIKALQSEWEQCKPESWKTNTAQDWFSYNARISRTNDGIPDWMDRIKSLGNAIVPQVVYPIMALIAIIDSECPHNNN